MLKERSRAAPSISVPMVVCPSAALTRQSGYGISEPSISMSSISEATVRYMTGLSTLVDWSTKIRSKTDSREVLEIFMRGVLSFCEARRALIVAPVPGKPVIRCRATQMGDAVAIQICDTLRDDEHAASASSGLAPDFTRAPFDHAADRSGGAPSAVAADVHWVSLNASEIGGDLLLIGEAGDKL